MDTTTELKVRTENKNEFLLGVYSRAVDRLMRIARANQLNNFSSGPYFAHIWNNKKWVSISDRIVWENYDKPSEKMFYSVSITFSKR